MVPLDILATIVATLHCSIANRKLTLVKRTVNLWHHYQRGRFARISNRFLVYPFSEIEDSLQVFFNAYVPRLGDVVVDLGSGDGSELAYFSQLVGASGRVVAIEPSAVNSAIQIETISKLSLKNVDVINCLISHSFEVVRFNFHETALDNHRSGTNGQGFLLSCSLDYLLDQLGVDHVDYLKINIEGDEKVVVPTLRLSRYRHLCISCHDFTNNPDQQTYSQVREWATSNNFKVIGTKPADFSTRSEDYYLYLSRDTSHNDIK